MIYVYPEELKSATKNQAKARFLLNNDSVTMNEDLMNAKNGIRNYENRLVGQ